MKLMQELISAKPSTVSEGYYSGDDLERFKKIANTIEDHLDELAPILRNDSVFSKLVRKLDGDPAQFAEVVRAFDALYEAVHDLHMYTDIHATAPSEDK